ncbi:hypothetical protein MKW94_001940 [Papaver nudicaule]|uniref:Elongation factor P n=1 Tax=Papaver nudicaule TaxID=74823 RepID=A0AA41RZM3_PAPNU|nr:hypothetical protein [Papaver nudicaule]
MAGITTFSTSSSSPCLRSSTSSSSAAATLSLSSNKPFILPMRLSSTPKFTPLRHKSTKIMSFTSNDIKVGASIEVDGAPWKVLEFLHVKPGKGAAFVRTKIRNYVTGSTVEKTFRAGISMSEADVAKEVKQYTYKEGAQFVFMDLTTYEEIRLNDSDVGDKKKWLKEGMDCVMHFWKGKCIDFELPITVKMTIIQTDPGLKGDTAQGGSKPATVDTGATVSVPLFINTGEDILVDTRTGNYMGRPGKEK